MTNAQNRGYVKLGKRQLQEVRNAVFSPSLKAIFYPSGYDFEQVEIECLFFL